METQIDDRGVEYVEDADIETLPEGWAICGTCHRAWNDEKSTSVTPVPSGRCPFEYEHEDDDDDEPARGFPIFEETTSPLVSSNDGRLYVKRILENDSRVYRLVFDDADVMSTHDRTLADAYIAGYDLARHNSPA